MKVREKRRIRRNEKEKDMNILRENGNRRIEKKKNDIDETFGIKRCLEDRKKKSQIRSLR